jgi:hypothetical protein
VGCSHVEAETLQEFLERSRPGDYWLTRWVNNSGSLQPVGDNGRFALYRR